MYPIERQQEQEQGQPRPFFLRNGLSSSLLSFFLTPLLPSLLGHVGLREQKTRHEIPSTWTKIV